MAGLGFLIYWVNSALAESQLASERNYRNLKTVSSLLLLTIIFGSLRLSLSEGKGVKTVAVAAVGTDSKIGGLPLPAEDVMRKDNATLMERTSSAAHSGAKIIVWNEGSTAILPVNESGWRDTLASLAAKERVALVAAYIVPVSVSPLKYENKFLLIMPDGKIAYNYRKHEPVPGEPAIKGKEQIQTVAIDQMKVGGAICYDYDFPYLAAEWGSLGTDLVALPSSDWRGIDPIHTQMAACRAIEQGQSVLRLGYRPRSRLMARWSR
jgi:apolipoprotein N-acyltransferase